MTRAARAVLPPTSSVSTTFGLWPNAACRDRSSTTSTEELMVRSRSARTAVSSTTSPSVRDMRWRFPSWIYGRESWGLTFPSRRFWRRSGTAG